MATDTAHRVIVVDQSLRSQVGHHLEYSLAVRNALKQAGLQSTIYAHVDCDKAIASQEELACFFKETWTQKSKVTSLSVLAWGILKLAGMNFRSLSSSHSFAQSLEELIQIERLSSSDHVLIHTLNFIQLVQALQVFSRNQGPKLHVVLRQDPSEASRGGLKAALLKLVFAVARGAPRVHFYSDTPALSREFEKISGIRFRTLPILFKQDLLISRHNARRNFVVTYLGDGRIEKGYHLLPQLIEDALPLNRDIVFELQSYVAPHSASEPRIKKSQVLLRELAQRAPGRVILKEMPLDQQEYASLLLGCDAVLIPYDPVAYRLRSSGILAQGAIAGKFLIYPSGTSLSDQVPPLLKNEYQHVREIPAILSRLASSEIPEPDKEKAARDFRAAHSPEAFVEALQIEG
jgi:hypothetical protein